MQYDPDGKKIAEYSSVNQAATVTGFNVATLLACAFTKKQSSPTDLSGDSWATNIAANTKHYRVGVPVTQWTLDGKKVQSFPTIKAAAENTGLTAANIQKNVKGPTTQQADSSGKGDKE